MDSHNMSIGQSSEAKRSSLPRVIWDPTPPVIIKKMLELTQVGLEDIVFDLGSGDARILLTAVKEFGAKKAVGYEINKDIYKKTIKEIQKQKLQDKIALIRDDLLNADISEASVITLFLSMEANEYLRPKLEGLSLNKNQISDITPLVENSGLSAEDEIWLEDNNLDLSEGSEVMKNIKALEDRGVVVHY